MDSTPTDVAHRTRLLTYNTRDNKLRVLCDLYGPVEMHLPLVIGVLSSSLTRAKFSYPAAFRLVRSLVYLPRNIRLVVPTCVQLMTSCCACIVCIATKDTNALYLDCSGWSLF